MSSLDIMMLLINS